MIDTIIVGLGAMGSAAAYQLARRGKKVLGLEQFNPVHDMGSSYGRSRMIRQAYWESPAYVPILLRAYELWQELERSTQTKLLHITGGLAIGPESSELVSGCVHSARKYNLRHEILDHTQIRRRFPPLIAKSGEIGLYEFMAGYLIPEECIRQQLNQAVRYGAELHFKETVQSMEVDDSKQEITIRTAKRTYHAEHLIISGGAWAPNILANLALPLTVTRQVMFWFDPIGGVAPFLPDRFPVYMFVPEPDYILYGFPSIDGRNGGVKIAIHGSDEICSASSIDRKIRQEDLDRIRSRVAIRVPSLNGPLVKAHPCMYTMTPDENPIICQHPHFPSVSIAAGFSGHGFKMASVIGEILADLVLDGTTRHDISLFSIRRFAGQCVQNNVQSHES